jgi:hypothetical protein
MFWANRSHYYHGLLGEARLQKEQALARMRQLQANVLEGKLLSASDVRACWAAAMASLRDRAMGMGDRIATRGAHRPPDELRSIVDAEVRELLEVLSRGNI